ncbi:MAG: hypothetical protein IKK11_03655, partial [Oscillospiraceae bacterium]|nr:hypothetical protein [Oscillospiraceae bacterium]
QVQEKYNSRVYNDIFSLYIWLVYLYVLMISFSVQLARKGKVISAGMAFFFFARSRTRTHLNATQTSVADSPNCQILHIAPSIR